jgi:pimeloyl-ACP methyl ester carboxylesterase
MSVGGPYAAAFAATYPDRTTSLALVSAPAMPDEAPDGTVEEEMARMAPEFLAWRSRIDPEDEDDEALAARFLAELPEADAALLAPLGFDVVGGLAWEALTKPEGYLRDAALLMRPWDFDVADVRCPATVWVGEHDAKAMAAATWWTDRLPQAALEVAPRTTHLATLLTQWPEILRRLGTATG